MLNFRFAKDYLLHRLRGKNRHGTHSPFVYRLLDEVIYDYKRKDIYNDIESIRAQLLSDNRVITVTDLGAGSLVNNNKRKKISGIAKHALTPPKQAQMLYRLVKDQQPQNMIELGTSLGTTAIYLKKAAPEAEFYTIEGCPEIANVAQGVFEKSKNQDIKLVVDNFDDTLKGVIDGLDRLDFVFVDGNHQKNATIGYFEWCLPKVHEGTLLAFHDIYWSKGMKEAWEQIKAHPQVTVAIDLFWMGLVYFKPGQAKEGFVIKI